MNRMFSIVIMLFIFNLNLILSDNAIKIDKKVIKDLENQVFIDDENEIFSLNEELSVQEYIKNMTIMTVSNDSFNEEGKGVFDVIKEIIYGIIDTLRNNRWVYLF